MKRASDAFVLHDPTGSCKYKIEFKDAILQVRRALINPNILNAHAEGLLKHNAQYPVNHTNILSYTIAKDIAQMLKRISFHHKSPRSLPLGLLRTQHIMVIINTIRIISSTLKLQDSSSTTIAGRQWAGLWSQTSRPDIMLYRIQIH